MNDDFEKRLQQVAPRKIPSAWREEILTAAQQAKASRHHSPTTHPGLCAFLIQQLSILTRPQRAAWAGLGAAWIVIFLLNNAANDDSAPRISQRTVPTSPEMQEVLQQQRQLLAELTDRPERREPQRPKSIAPGPRSERREDWATA
jgi:hypothetical protein